MGGMLRCDGCGSVRWDVLGLTGSSKPTACENCGEELKPERRRPGRRARARRFEPAPAERRDVAPPPAA